MKMKTFALLICRIRWCYSTKLSCRSSRLTSRCSAGCCWHLQEAETTWSRSRSTD